MTEIYCIITGDVQRVGFRAYAQDSATDLKIVGYVKNQPDGSVVVVAQGYPDVLKEYVEYLNEGSSLSSVVSVAVDWRSPSRSYDEFSILH